MPIYHAILIYMYISDNGTAYTMSNFCPAAQRFTGKKGKCCDCPFKNCICDVHPAELKILRYAHKAIQAYNSIANGVSDQEIINMLGITRRQLQYWKVNRKIIQTRINNLI